MFFLLKKRFQDSCRFGKRGVAYIIISTVGIGIELARFYLQRPFALVMWLIIFGLGIFLLFFRIDQQKS